MGWGATLLGVDSDVPIVSFIPVMLFAIRRADHGLQRLPPVAHQRGVFRGGHREGERHHGLSRIAKVILLAGLIMAAVFLAFMSANDVTVKIFGLGLGIAILSTCSRAPGLSPALMPLLGDQAWWMPRWLDRLVPNVSLEGHLVEGVDERSAPLGALPVDPDPEPEPVGRA